MKMRRQVMSDIMFTRQDGWPWYAYHKGVTITISRSYSFRNTYIARWWNATEKRGENYYGSTMRDALNRLLNNLNESGTGSKLWN